MSKDTNAQFLLLIHGQIQRGMFPGIPDLCVKVNYSYGPDWSQLAGATELLSACCSRGQSDSHVIDLPFEATFTSTNPYRWPQLVVSCYGRDVFGNDVIRGYGALPIPTTPGRHQREIPCFVPEPSSTYQRIVGYISGNRPEFVDTTFVTQPHSRHATRVSTQGLLTVNINVVVKDAKKYSLDITQIQLANPKSFAPPNLHATIIQKTEAEPYKPQEARPLPNLSED